MLSWYDQCTEAIFGHVETEDEKMAKIKSDLDGVLKECHRSILRNKIYREQSEKKQTLLAKRGKYEELKRETKDFVIKEKEATRLERNRNRVEIFKSQLETTKVDRVLTTSKLSLMSIKINNPKILLSESQISSILNKYKYNEQNEKNIMALIDEEMEEIDEEEEEMNEDDNQRMEEIVKFHMDLANHEEFNKFPKPNGVIVSPNVLNVTEKTMNRINQEEKQKLDAFLSNDK